MLMLGIETSCDETSAAVVEETDGRLSYWALTHPAERPDFHHRDGFVLVLEGPDVDSAFAPSDSEA